MPLAATADARPKLRAFTGPRYPTFGTLSEQTEPRLPGRFKVQLVQTYNSEDMIRNLLRHQDDSGRKSNGSENTL